MSQDLPSAQNYFNFCRFELNVETLIESPINQGTADRVLRDDDPLAKIDPCNSGGHHEHIGLRSGNDERVDLATAKMLVELWVAESGTNDLIEYGRRRRISSENRQEIDKPAVDLTTST
jgi:hypothetical protein